MKSFELSLPFILGHGVKKKATKEVVKKNVNSVSLLDKLTSFFSDKTKNDVNLFKLTRRPLVIGIIVILVFFGFFGLWSAFAPIEGAVVANGQVVSSSNRKIIQHLEGGVIEKILVKEGDKVIGGEILIKLKNISSKSQKRILEDKLYNLKITEARLVAERDDKEKIVIGDDIKFSKIIDNQERLFIAHRNNLASQIAILHARIEQNIKEKEGIEGQLLSEQEQMKLVEEELTNKRKLLASGNIDRPHVIALEKQFAVLNGKIAGDNALIARIDQQISSTKLEILNLKNKFQNDVVSELKEVQSNISDIEERLLTVCDIFDRTEIRAPQSGKVTNLQYHTVGGVISPSAKIMEIIPNNDDLVIEAKILPKDIDAVLYAQDSNVITIDGITGGVAKVKVLALNTRKVGLLQGVITNLSADTIVDPKTPVQYYRAQVKIPKSQLKSVANSTVNLYPGMPVAVFIITEPRTLLSYLLSPISSTLDRAFRER
ncbi:MAG: HlyD family type I secretion periplasmic adaptor subunit [Rickettsiaceae bacterium H1]|nr:HlyD family type I secretion periplasmic adaptor subunit [Rickettsiaceae bacterium H1]